MWKVLIFITILMQLNPLNGFKILIVVPTPSKSHAILGDGLVTYLSEAGHEITYITAFAPSKPHPRVTFVTISDKVVIPDEINIQNIMDKKLDEYDIKKAISNIMKMNQLTLESSTIQSLLADKNQKFDVVIAEWFINDLFAGFSAVFNCPLIWFSTMELHNTILQLVDEPFNPAYSISLSLAAYPPLTFKQRITELFYFFLGKIVQYFVLSGLNDELYQTHFVPFIRDRGHIVPSYETLRLNGSLLLVNSHVSLGSSTSLPQNVKQIGGFHIDKNIEPLPQNLQNVMDKAEHGVIYFSLGSNLRSKEFPMHIKRDLLQMFGKLKQTIIWKFEEELPDLPSNVIISRWAPQQSILAHKNCILFITHGGLLSITESIHFGVPIIGIPGFGDQYLNINRYVNKGVAKKVDLSYAIVTDLQMAIQDIINDPTYTAKVKELSMIYHDRPIHPGKELVHWVEHVVKTQGARHLRSPAFLMPWYQKMYLDLLLVIFILTLILKYIVTFIIRLVTIKQKIH